MDERLGVRGEDASEGEGETAEDGRVRLYVDGKLAGQGTLRPKAAAPKQIVRIGLTSENFPSNQRFRGRMESVAFYQRALTEDELRAKASKDRCCTLELDPRCFYQIVSG